MYIHRTVHPRKLAYDDACCLGPLEPERHGHLTW
jgi:hypothetical protein